MSYSSLNDAFNINSDFEKTLRGLNSFNPSNNNIDNIKSNYFDNNKEKKYDNNYQNNFYDPNAPQPLIDGMYSNDDNLSWESLNGTDLYSKDINLPNKLTHRECIEIYNNPESCKDSNLSQALKHVSKCKMCKDEIKKRMTGNIKNEKNEKNTKQNLKQNTHSNQIFSSNEKKINNNIDNLSLLSSLQNNYDPINKRTLNLVSQENNLSNSKIESELKLLSDKINGETNLKYQNALIQNNISKYLEDLEERKKINQKLDNILEIIKTDCCVKQDTTSKPNNNNDLKDNNLLSILSSPQFLLNLSKLNEQNITNTQPITQPIAVETYFLYIAIFIIMILLIIDVVLRLNKKTE